jgi:hypothetical protein
MSKQSRYTKIKGLCIEINVCDRYMKDLNHEEFSFLCKRKEVGEGISRNINLLSWVFYKNLEG